MKHHLPFFVCAAVLPLSAQTPDPQALPAPPDTNFVFASPSIAMPGLGSAMTLMLHEFSFQGGKPVTGAPYSAEQVIEHVQVLPDGNRIVNTSTARLYRDSHGRTRTETTPPHFAGGPTPPAMVTISDPVAGFTYFLDSENKTAQRIPSKPVGYTKVRDGAVPPLPPPPPLPNSGFASIQIKTATALPKADVKKQDLGTQDFGGLAATGTRVTEIIPAGAIGNEQPIQTTSERWYSPDLQLVVKSVRNDPRMGQTTETLNNITRSEPDASLFQIPADYTLADPKAHTLNMDGLMPE